MSEERRRKLWNDLREQLQTGDPIKDVCDEYDLADYIQDLRGRLGLKEEES
jgi:hypothetical protein